MEFLNRGPSDLTSDALPTELSRLHESFAVIWVGFIYTIFRCDRTILNPSTIDVMVDSPSKRQKPARYKFPSSENLFLVRVVIYIKLEEYSLVIIQIITKVLNSNRCRT